MWPKSMCKAYTLETWYKEAFCTSFFRLSYVRFLVYVIPRDDVRLTYIPRSCKQIKINPIKFWPRPCQTSLVVVAGRVHRKFILYLPAVEAEGVTQCIAAIQSSQNKKLPNTSFSLPHAHQTFRLTAIIRTLPMICSFGNLPFFFSSADVEALLRRYPELGTELLAKMRGIRPVEKWVITNKDFLVS